MAGKSADFDAFYREYGRKLYGVAFRLVQNREDALDVLNEGFLRAYRHWKRFRGGAKVSTWLYRIIVNLSYDCLRKRSRTRHVQLFEDYDYKQYTYHGEREVMNKTLADQVKNEIASLTEKQRAVFVLKIYEELPFKEIAEATSSRIGTVKATYFQALQKIRRNLREKGVMLHDV